MSSEIPAICISFLTVVLSKLNALLVQLHVTSRLKTVADIGAGVFVTLFEGLCGEQLPGTVKLLNFRTPENIAVIHLKFKQRR